jgi:hypothetical protein
MKPTTPTKTRLSRNMKAVLTVMFCCEQWYELDRHGQTNIILEQLYGGRNPSTEASVSRLWRTLERQGMIQRVNGQWLATPDGKLAGLSATTDCLEAKR